MTIKVNRFLQNPLLRPSNVKPSRPGLEVACLLNPGVFEFDNKTWLIIRVAERPQQKEDTISFPVLKDGGIEIIEIAKSDPQLDATDPRVIRYKGVDYLTTLSHLRLFHSSNGIDFQEAADYPQLHGEGPLETFGVEDCRVTQINDTYYLTFTSVSPNGVAVGMRTTRNWKHFTHHGLILPPHNKDCALFTEPVNGYYYALHRPSSVDLGGNYIWLAQSPDTQHWGNHQCLARTRPGRWDSVRIGAGAAPVKTAAGWLEIYHGADENHRYGLGALLLDLHNPAVVLARSEEPIMIPEAPYELTGFFGHVVFTNGHTVKDDQLTLYYGAADEVVCAASFSIREILSSLNR
ncbi:glycoside hydrolase family 130 protein [Chitinophaga sp. 212800010-3]|uniref:glycoside hydrolase family 130 protein n=1 Tax=unclassified Chitinophaga TaxID=2619133 RepID=UPI002DEE50FC|nr:Glycosidase [Chitinophaga sp. 212800010-3]